MASWTVRTSKCRSALLDLGVSSERITVGADLAWLLSGNPADRQWAQGYWESLGIDLTKPLFGVNAVNERWTKTTGVKSAIAQALDNMIRDAGVQVAFLCNETREGEYFDACAAREIIAKMSRKAVSVPNRYFTPSQMVALLSFCSMTLSQRYHFTLFSILAGPSPFLLPAARKWFHCLKNWGKSLPAPWKRAIPAVWNNG